MTTYKTGEFSNSTDQDLKAYFSGQSQCVETYSENIDLPSGVYRIVNGHLVPAAHEKQITPPRDGGTKI